MAHVSILREKEQELQSAWKRYRAEPDSDRFVEFALLLNHFIDLLTDKSESGLLHFCRQLEQRALAFFGNDVKHPLSTEDTAGLDEGIARLAELLRAYLEASGIQKERRADLSEEKSKTSKHTNVPHVSLLGEKKPYWRELVTQLGYFGILAKECGKEIPETEDTSDIGVYLVDFGGRPSAYWQEILHVLRERRSMSRILCIGVPNDFLLINSLLKAGASHCVTDNIALQQLLILVMDRATPVLQNPYRVLVVEDSMTAAKAIERILKENGMTARVLNDPSQSLQAIRQFQPDLILMDMHMPCCTGVEVAKVIRQYEEFLSIPIVFLSGETNVGLQVEALRLGGDQFLTKPANPILMSAVIKSKIERYRALRRSMNNDSLTDLLNHISAKQALAGALERFKFGDTILAIAMLDIDHFKQINDRHGHPVGDQVIRSLAWFLKQRLRRDDIVGRYGGEEFVVGLACSQPYKAKEVLDRIREDFSHISFSGAEGVQFQVTFSIGVTAHVGAAASLEALLDAADAALYQAKRQGRNQVVLSPA